MKLLRTGLYRNRGEKTLFYKDNIDVKFYREGIKIHTSGQGASDTTHFFTLELSYKDIADIIGSLEIRDEKSKKLNASLRENLLDKKEILLQLLMLTSDFLEEEYHEKQ